MSSPVLEKDSVIQFPHFMILKASAGSGKTYMLTKRFVQFILSEKIHRNSLRNILAVTFSNNAAKEMKERILQRLKAVCFDDLKSMDEMCSVLSLDRERIKNKAAQLIEEILDNYSDFQVKTIDSFMTTVFKASAIDFGYNPEFEILMSVDALMEYSFDRFLRDVRDGTGKANLFEEIIGRILEQKKREAAYPWDPSSVILDEIKNIYGKLSSTGRKASVVDLSSDMQALKVIIRAATGELEDMVLKSGLDKNKNSSYTSVLEAVGKNMFSDIIGKQLKNPPVNKPGKKQPALQNTYERITDKWAEVVELFREYTTHYARNFYMPYLKVYEEFRAKIEEMKRRQGKIFIEDVNRYLAEYLGSEIIPDVYFRLGETVFHYLIDEFQDTSPIQWRNLYPLLENSLSQGGSLFIVGDTKQAIYGFRDADYTIMKDSEKSNPFPSSEHVVNELDTNYRSLQKILDFNENIFKKTAALNDSYKEAGKQSGLTDYTQRIKEGNKDAGYAEAVIYERDDENPPEREKIQEIIQDLTRRGFVYMDIAVLTQKNEDAVRAASWLNEKGTPFISFSSLDIRRRKAVGEIVSLLNFLDSPTDDLSFASFILGNVFNRILTKDSIVINIEQIRAFLFTHKNNPPLYKAFQREYEHIWKRYFEGPFRSTGYLPLYDLVTEVFSVFRVFETMENEEAAFVKILEAAKEFEGAGHNSLKDFLEFNADSDTGDAEWNMDAPKDIPAVKVMTVHKSKGLGFPVVIVLLYAGRNRGFDYMMEETEEDVRPVRLTKDTSKCDPSLEAIYNKESLKELVNKLNSLYVGFTRAEQELYVIGVKGRKETFPFDLLPLDNFPPSAKPERGKRAGDNHRQAFEIGHYHKNLKFQTRSDDILNIKEKQRGEFIHRVLYFVEYITDGFEDALRSTIKRVAAETGFLDEIKASLLAFLTHNNIVEFFKQQPHRKVMREQEFSDGEGRLYRMDRVVIDADKITVMDFKTGPDKDAEEKYETQIKTYMKLLRDIYPDKQIEGVIAYVDLKEIRRIF
jgi:ATP-dependent helicase/nuclease subunit A